MPPVPGIANLVQILVKEQWATGENVANSLHMSSSNGGPYSVGDLTVLAAAVQNQWATHMSPLQSADLTLEEVVAIDRSVEDGNHGIDNTTQVGGQAAAPLGLNTSVLMQWSDSAHYRGGHPRTYVAGATNDATTDGAHLTAAAKTAWGDAWASFLTGVLAGGPYGSIRPLTWVAAHYQRKGVVGFVPNFSVITSLGPASLLATQRRRLRKAAHS